MSPLSKDICSAIPTTILENILKREEFQTTISHFVEVFSVTKFGKIFKKTSATTSSIGCRGFSGCSI
jgi:hypothetical protein